MRYIIIGLTLAGCAAEGAGLQDTALPFAPLPPPGATTEARYTFDCSTLTLPAEGAPHNIAPRTTLPDFMVPASIPGFTLDPDHIPLDMVIYTRVSDELLDWAKRHEMPIEQGVDWLRSDVAFDEEGHAMIECGALPACIEYPCHGWTEDMTPNWPELVGWTEGRVELIVWE